MDLGELAGMTPEIIQKVRSCRLCRCRAQWLLSSLALCLVLQPRLQPLSSCFAASRQGHGADHGA